MQQVLEWPAADLKTFRPEQLPPDRPVVLRQLVAHWPLVQQGKVSDEAACNLLLRHATPALVDAVLVPPEHEGRVGLSPALDGFSFARNRVTLPQVLQYIARYSHFEHPPAVAAQSAPIEECLPGLLSALTIPALPSHVRPRIWVGNAIVTPTHFDESSNIACAVAGRRRFTLFPPDQVANLYLGPLDMAPTHTPISLADPASPDYERFPRFREAMAQAQAAELAPGDAIYIPPLWWHHVMSLARFNVLVNYWWREDRHGQHPDSALGALWHAVLCLRQLPEGERATWAGIFQHFVFGESNAATHHLPPNTHGMLGRLDDAQRKALRQRICALLDRR